MVNCANKLHFYAKAIKPAVQMGKLNCRSNDAICQVSYSKESTVEQEGNKNPILGSKKGMNYYSNHAASATAWLHLPSPKEAWSVLIAVCVFTPTFNFQTKSYLFALQ